MFQQREMTFGNTKSPDKFPEGFLMENELTFRGQNKNDLAPVPEQTDQLEMIPETSQQIDLLGMGEPETVQQHEVVEEPEFFQNLEAAKELEAILEEDQPAFEETQPAIEDPLPQVEIESKKVAKNSFRVQVENIQSEQIQKPVEQSQDNIIEMDDIDDTEPKPVSLSIQPTM